MKKPLLILLIIGSLGALAYYSYEHPRTPVGEVLLYGNVDVRQVDLGFQVSGRVERMFFQEGDIVEPGALLGVLDKRPYQDQMRQATANAEAININYANAKKLLERRQELIEGGGISQEDLDNALTSYDALAANYKQAQATEAIAQTNLDYTEVYAPSPGVILTRIREPGTVVGAGDAIYTLSITVPVWIRAYVSEPQLGLIYPGMEGEVHTDVPGGKTYVGKIGFISPVAEFTPKTVETTQLRTDLVYRLRLYIDHPDEGLRQGMPVTVRLKIQQDKL